MIKERSGIYFRLCAVALAFIASVAVAQQDSGEELAYQASTHGTRWLEGSGGLAIKVLVEESNLGGAEVEIGEITFPAGSESVSHVHGSVEIFYILSGELEHIVNGVSHPLEPGMVGIVRVGDRVIHKVNSHETPVKALVIWAPGGEAERLARFFKERPVESD